MMNLPQMDPLLSNPLLSLVAPRYVPQNLVVVGALMTLHCPAAPNDAWKEENIVRTRRRIAISADRF